MDTADTMLPGRWRRYGRLGRSCFVPVALNARTCTSTSASGGRRSVVTTIAIEVATAEIPNDTQNARCHADAGGVRAVTGRTNGTSWPSPARGFWPALGLPTRTCAIAGAGTLTASDANINPLIIETVTIFTSSSFEQRRACSVLGARERCTSCARNQDTHRHALTQVGRTLLHNSCMHDVHELCNVAHAGVALPVIW